MRRALVLCLWMALVSVFGFLARPANAGKVAVVDDIVISETKNRTVGRTKPELPRPKASADYARPSVVVDPGVRLPQNAIVYKVKLQPVTEDALRVCASTFRSVGL